MLLLQRRYTGCSIDNDYRIALNQSTLRVYGRRLSVAVATVDVPFLGRLQQVGKHWSKKRTKKGSGITFCAKMDTYTGFSRWPPDSPII